MKKDTSYSFQSKKGMEVTFEELHIRHINLLIDIKNKELNNWFLKMAIINTFDDLKIFCFQADVSYSASLRVWPGE